MSRIALGMIAVVLASCSPPPPDKWQAAFARELDLYFNNLNNEALARKEMYKSATEAHAKNPTLPPWSGVQYNSFHFSEKGFIAYDVKCKGKECGATYMVVDFYGSERKCSRCGEVLIAAKPESEPDTAKWIEKQTGSAPKPMFEVTNKDTKKEMKATVRYIRRNWSFDPRGRSDIDPVKLGKAEVKAEYLPGTGGKVAPGFHRPDSVFVAEQEFAFDGKLKPVGSPKETAVKPWNELWDVRANPVDVATK